MDEPDVGLVERLLRLEKLTHEIFDPEEIAGDLVERTELNQTLDDLIESSDNAPAPATFDPSWAE